MSASMAELKWPEYILVEPLFECGGFDYDVNILRHFEKRIDGRWETDRRAFMLIVYHRPDLANWNHPFSFLQYGSACESAVRQIDPNAIFRYVDNEDELIKMEFRFAVPRSEGHRPLKGCIDPFKEKVVKIHELALVQLSSSNHEKLLTYFDFPDAVRTPCQQYLAYFSTFLKDLGLQAQSTVAEEAGRVLFSVTPTDDKTALAQIRKALALYLNLADAPVAFDDSFPAMRMQQQIDNLRHSQSIARREIQLSQRVIEAQDRIISEKNITIDHQAKLLAVSNPRIMVDSAANKGEIIEIFEGLRIGESEKLGKWLGIFLNPARALTTAGKAVLGEYDKPPSIVATDEDD